MDKRGPPTLAIPSATRAAGRTSVLALAVVKELASARATETATASVTMMSFAQSKNISSREIDGVSLPIR
jgi:hypothetical protein